MKTVKEFLYAIGFVLAGLIIISVWGTSYTNYENAPYKDTVEATATDVNVTRAVASKNANGLRKGEYYYAYDITWEFDLNGEKAKIKRSENSKAENAWSVGDKSEVQIYSEDGKEYKVADLAGRAGSNKWAYFGGIAVVVMGAIYMILIIVGIIKAKK